MIKKKIFIIAGEASGDKIGGLVLSKLSKKLAKKYSLEIRGIGGKKMEKAGLNSLFPMEEISLMGFTEIIPHIFRLRRLIKSTIDVIKEFEPDIVITIDSPGFSTRVTSAVKSEINAKLVHIVAPSVWAYKPERAKKFAKIYDLLLTLLPFEPPYFEVHGLKSIFAGHFIFEQKICDDVQIFRDKYEISEDHKLICITPGSRTSEVAKHLPIFLDACAQLTKSFDLKVAILAYNDEVAEKARLELESRSIDALVTTEDHFAAYKASDIALAKSGTNSLEIAMHSTPQIVAYKVNFISWIYIKFKILVKFANLINIVANKEIIPEFLQGNCNSSKIAASLKLLLSDEDMRRKQIKETAKALDTMKNPSGCASDIVAREIIKILK